MEILGIGTSELLFIVIIAIIILGPKDMQKAGKTIGRWLNRLINSEGWQGFVKTSQEIRKLPTTLMREANMEMMQTNEEIRKSIGNFSSPPKTYRSPKHAQPAQLNENPITTDASRAEMKDDETTNG